MHVIASFFAIEFSLFAHVCLHVNVLLAFCVVSVNVSM
jgi:hypothetical protein